MARWRWTVLVTGALVACGGGDGQTDPAGADGAVDDSTSPDDSGAIEGGSDTSDAGTDAPTGCTRDEDCLAGKTFDPVDCASAKCDATTGLCKFTAKDVDGDGFPAAKCSAPGVDVTLGTDCDDTTVDVKPGAAEVCDGKDNDCNGKVDDEIPMSTEDCTVGLGECTKTGKKTCVDGGWKGCSATAGTPTTETCDGKDNDCDGTIDTPACECVDGTSQACGKSGIGSCKKGTQTCLGGKWQACIGNVDPKATDTCVAGNDDDCDGIVTNGPIPNSVCKCLDGAKADCATALGSKGTCAKGTSTCSGGKWGACSIAPKPYDSCDIGNDDSCDGNATKDAWPYPTGCNCLNGKKAYCNAGELGTAARKGACGNVIGATCVAGAWNTSARPTYMGVDVCDTSSPQADNDCNGTNFNGCLCVTGYGYPCTTATICSNGTRGCVDGKAGTYSACTATSSSSYAQTYRYDADGDGKCAAKLTGSYPYYSTVYREVTSCSSPGPGWKYAGTCTVPDCYDNNPDWAACSGFLPPSVNQDWGKPWRGFGNCEDHTVSIDCGAGFVFTSYTITKKNGGGNWYDLGSSGGGTRWGSATGRVCDNGFESATLSFSLSCWPYGATSAF